jgi:DsbC/DsbD-like thiol-disulfide interchange protein
MAPRSAASVVTTTTYVSAEPVAQGKEFQAAVVVKIADGYHMNSHKPSDAYLIPTTLTPQLPAGFKLVEAVYPAGRNKTFPFSPDKPLNVYSGSVTLRLRLTADASTPLGPITIPITLRYQACNNSACLPPVKIPVSVKLEVAAAGTKSHPVHGDIFSAGAGE